MCVERQQFYFIFQQVVHDRPFSNKEHRLFINVYWIRQFLFFFFFFVPSFFFLSYFFISIDVISHWIYNAHKLLEHKRWRQEKKFILFFLKIYAERARIYCCRLVTIIQTVKGGKKKCAYCLMNRRKWNNVLRGKMNLMLVCSQRKYSIRRFLNTFVFLCYFYCLYPEEVMVMYVYE